MLVLVSSEAGGSARGARLPSIVLSTLLQQRDQPRAAPTCPIVLHLDITIQLSRLGRRPVGCLHGGLGSECRCEDKASGSFPLFRRRLPLKMSGEDAYAVLGLVETAADSEVRCYTVCVATLMIPDPQSIPHSRPQVPSR